VSKSVLGQRCRNGVESIRCRRRRSKAESIQPGGIEERSRSNSVDIGPKTMRRSGVSTIEPIEQVDEAWIWCESG
jgi:hypothetical protein